MQVLQVLSGSVNHLSRKYAAYSQNKLRKETALSRLLVAEITDCHRADAASYHPSRIQAALLARFREDKSIGVCIPVNRVETYMQNSTEPVTLTFLFEAMRKRSVKAAVSQFAGSSLVQLTALGSSSSGSSPSVRVRVSSVELSGGTGWAEAAARDHFRHTWEQNSTKMRTVLDELWLRFGATQLCAMLRASTLPDPPSELSSNGEWIQWATTHLLKDPIRTCSLLDVAGYDVHLDRHWLGLCLQPQPIDFGARKRNARAIESAKRIAELHGIGPDGWHLISVGLLSSDDLEPLHESRLRFLVLQRLNQSAIDAFPYLMLGEDRPSIPPGLGIVQRLAEHRSLISPIARRQLIEIVLAVHVTDSVIHKVGSLLREYHQT